MLMTANQCIKHVLQISKDSFLYLKKKVMKKIFHRKAPCIYTLMCQQRVWNIQYINLYYIVCSFSLILINSLIQDVFLNMDFQISNAFACGKIEILIQIYHYTHLMKFHNALLMQLCSFYLFIFLSFFSLFFIYNIPCSNRQISN